MQASRIDVNGRTTKLNDDDETLSTMQTAVGGFVERLQINKDVVLLMNEDGQMLDLPPNHKASKLAGRMILGPVVKITGSKRW